ncbi:MAG: phosphate ABC transporter permease PstA, partial [Candidatus Bathyarchaeota archaeon]
MNGKRVSERLFFALFRACALLVAAIVIGLMAYVFGRGLPALTPDFLLSPPEGGMLGGGISTAIAGSLMLMFWTVVFALPLGVGAAIYLSEYTVGVDSRVIRAVRLAISNLAGVPSVVYGLLGLGLFVLFMGLGFSVLSSSLTLSLLTLPVIISASEEALKSVPRDYREASLALGASRWETIRNVVLPSALPGIMTACILGLSRAAGETAPLLMTGAAYYLPRLSGNILRQFMALSTHIYYMATQSPNPGLTRPIQFGAIAV